MRLEAFMRTSSFVPVAERNLRPDGRALARRDSTAKLPPTISARSRMPSRPKAYGVWHTTRVRCQTIYRRLDFQAHVFWTFCSSLSPGWPGVPGDVRERGLGDAIKHRAPVAAQLFPRRQRRELHADFRPFRDSFK